MKVLVAYSSAHGSTRGVAERIASQLGSHGLTVDCRPAGEVDTVSQYEAVVAGSALHGRAWLEDGTRFISVNTADLATKPVWLFSVGMPAALARPLRRSAMREGHMAVAPFLDTLAPRDIRLFSGVVSKQQFPMWSRAVLRLMGGHYGDFRDWADIDGWAGHIADDLLASRSPPRLPR